MANMEFRLRRAEKNKPEGEISDNGTKHKQQLTVTMSSNFDEFLDQFGASIDVALTADFGGHPPHFTIEKCL